MRRTRLRAVLFVALVWAMLGLHTRGVANDKQTFSLADALRVMRRSHPALLARAYAVEARIGDQVATKLWTNPLFGGNYAKGIRHTSYDPAGYITYGVTQFVELANAPLIRKRQASFLVSAERAERADLALTLSLALESALIDLVAAQKAQELLDETWRQLIDAARIVDERVKAGAAPRYDATRIGVALALAEADQRVGLAMLARAWAEFRAAVGPGVDELHGEPRYDLAQGPPLPDASTLVSRMEQTRPDLAAARAQLRAAQEGVRLSRRNVFQGVLVSLGGGFGAGPRQVDLGAGVAVPLPIVDHGQGAIAAAKARSLSAAAQVDAVRRPAALRLLGMLHDVELRRQALHDFRARLLPAGLEMLEQAQAGYVAGRFSVLELADAYVTFRDAHLREIELAVSVRRVELELGRELGYLLWEP